MATAVEFALQEFPEAVKVEQTLNVVLYQQVAEEAFEQDAVLLPGVDLQPEHETFRVSFGKPEE
jgi:hypothetical protein